ncbi:hypothetical protein Sjap_000072 [Stephania japonica]|uniref:Transglutaminase-like domain-containing protein n=1 Tax=Stephania japonica TaxID=461633 RepID=A0AAP0KHD5_9MAGN
MVARKLLVQHRDSQFDLDYDTEDGIEVLKFQLFSLTSIPPDEQQARTKISLFCDLLISDDSDLDAVTGMLRLVSIGGEDGSETVRIEGHDDEGSNAVPIENDNSFEQSDEELARMLQAEEDALFYQQFQASDNGRAFEQRIRPYVTQVVMYEDRVRQEAARRTVPMDELEEKALVSLAKEGNFKPSKVEQDHTFLLQLLLWFKRSFRWVNSPPCDYCASGTEFYGTGVALPAEIQFQGSRVELYRCSVCSKTTRFPRYNDPLKLVETRRGRCGEWANCFTLYCRAFGYESRLVLDFTDHVWTECYSSYLERWMHLDPCEGIYDNPLLYEKGWGKKLNYVISIAKDGVYDVTKRYTRKWHEVLTRRNITTEPIASNVLSEITKGCRHGFAPQELSLLNDRDKTELEKLERGLHSLDDTSIQLPGRQSGAKEWRKSRLELGANENDSLGCFSCPIRKCVDEHICRIYNAFYPLVSHFVDNDLTKSRLVEVLELLKRLLLDLSKMSFRLRRVLITSDSYASKIFTHEMLPPLDDLLVALSLKVELQSDERLSVCLADDPVKTSIALPVTLDHLDEIVDNLKNCVDFPKDSLTSPLLKLNRISSGLVRASGEELPFGIATSAFDGIRNSKWEEPNGAKGSWITYETTDGKMHNLETYELMSANDAPERDPMNWVLEGSNDGGLTWYILDERTSQMFEHRFQRKVFKVESVEHPSNAFRFKFLSVRDVEATPRLQIGSIDLYEMPS